TGIELLENGTTPVNIRLVINGKKLMIYPDPTPPLWDRNMKYELKIKNHVVEDTSGAIVLPLPAVITPSTLPLTYNIKTDFLTFEELMSGSRKINQIIDDYTPRNILVKSPVRYLEQFDVIHKRQSLVQSSTTESVTNIDFTIDDKAI